MVHYENPTKTLQESEKIYDSWFEIYLLVHVSKLMKQQKWNGLKANPLVSEYSRNIHLDSIISRVWTRTTRWIASKSENLISKQYNEESFRETFRAVRGLVIIRRVNESDIMTGLGKKRKLFPGRFPNLFL